jgi:hypothetical protein
MISWLVLNHRSWLVKEVHNFVSFNMGRILMAIEFGSDVMTHDTIMSHLKLRDNNLFKLLENS